MTIEACIKEISDLSIKLGRPVKFMEVCGTHTMAAFRTGFRSLLPSGVSLLSGPGCPVCVTPNGYLDSSIAIAFQDDVIVTSFGDMIRVPGTESSLEGARAGGADVRIVYSPLDAVQVAKDNPDKKVVFLGVGFETTTPGVAWTIKHARDQGISNYSVLCAHKTIPEAMDVLLQDEQVMIDGFMCPGHVSVITGAAAYEEVASIHKIPCVVAGFEAYDMAETIRMLMRQLVDGRSDVEIEYTRSVTREGNGKARELGEEVFQKCDVEWRGVGVIPASGLEIRDVYSDHDAGRIFSGLEVPEPEDHKDCRCGDVLKGICLPLDCKMFGAACTPVSPIGPCMVSSEGSCAAYYKYGRAGVLK